MTYQLNQEAITKNPVLEQFLKDPSSINEMQWDQLLEPDNYSKYLVPTEDYKLNCAEFLCKMGLIEPLKVLADQYPKKFQKMIQYAENYRFQEAAENGRIEVLQLLEEKVPNFTHRVLDKEATKESRRNGTPFVFQYKEVKGSHSLQDMVKADNYRAFQKAAENGHIEVLKYLEEKAPNLLQNMIEADNYHVFKKAISNGHSEVLRYLGEKAPEYLQNMIKTKDFPVEFRWAADNGHFEVFKYLIDSAPELVKIMIKSSRYHTTFFCHLEELKYLEEKAPGLLEDRIRANDYAAFKSACFDSLDVLKFLSEKHPNFLTIKFYMVEVFQLAARGGQLESLKYLADNAPNLLEDMIKDRDYRAFQEAIQMGHQEVTNWLLQQPSCFVYAEQHVREYENHVYPFIQETLLTLHNASDAALELNPNAVFNIESPEQARLCFYIMRNLIRRNDRTQDDELRFLLNIPAVKALAHQEVTQGQPNELLRLAVNTGNTVASSLLLNIEAVRVLAEQNNFYREEARRGVDLRQLAHDRESSMAALTTGEAKKLEGAIAHYQPLIKNAGLSNVMQGLKNELIVCYEKNPASIIDSQGKAIILPLDYTAFQALKLKKADYDKALIAYYKHQDHTALRYLSKPNAWMHPDASYVYISEDRTQRWSTFEEYQPLIAMFYLAATDTKAEATQGHNLETRFNHFINELALIGRAHNWDRTRIRNDKEEEYDDLEGDRPSCFSGVKRRLFQSVVGHPLFEVLDEAKIENEIRQFAVEHFKSILTEENKPRFKKIFDECFGLDEESGWIQNTKNADKLRCFDIPEDKQKEFITHLTQKYGDEFTQDEALVSQVHSTLLLNPKDDNLFRHHHALMLFSLTNLNDFLDPSYRIVNEKETSLVSLKSTSKRKEPESTTTSSSTTQSNTSNNQPQVQDARATIINAILEFCNRPANKTVDGLVKMKAILANQDLGTPEKINQTIALAQWKKSDWEPTRFFHQKIRNRSPEVEAFYRSLAALDWRSESANEFLDQFSSNIEQNQSKRAI